MVRGARAVPYGAVLTKEELLIRIKSVPPLLKSMVDPNVQIGPNGVDLTLNHVESFLTVGSVDFSNVYRVLSKSSIVNFDDEGWVHLQPGAYKAVYNEIVTLPNDLIAIARPRSTLLRCGATVETAVWDAGYRGRSVSLLLVHNPKGLRLKKNARIVQLVFIKLSQPVQEGYEGIYQGEKISEK